MTKPQAAASPSPCRIMAAAAAAANQDAVQPEGSPMRAISVCSDESCHASMVKKALSRAQRENRRLQRRVRYPALALGFLLMAGSMYLAFTSWTSQAQLALLVRDLLRSLGFISWLCACLPSDRWAPKVGSLLLIILGVKCLIWNTQKVAVYAHQLTDHLEAGQKCHIENEEVDCFLGAYIIGTTSLTYVVMRVWQLPYLAYGLILPSRATMGRLWVGLALPHLAEGITALIAVLPSMVVKMRMGKAICSDMVLCTSLRGVYGLMSGILLMLPGFRRWVHFRLLAASGAFTAAGSIAAFLGSRSAAKVMEVARNTCRYVTLDKVTKQDLMNSSPDSALKRLSVPCHLPDIDAFLSHSWHDSATNKWQGLF